jgi:hypothetical protein
MASRKLRDRGDIVAIFIALNDDLEWVLHQKKYLL